MERYLARIDSPPFVWDNERLRHADWVFLREAALAVGAARHLSSTEQGELVVDALSRETAASAEIDGEPLSPESVKACVRREMRLSFDDSATDPMTCGAAGLTVEVLRHGARHLGARTLSGWGALVSTARPTKSAQHELRRFVRWFGGSALEDNADTMPLVRAGLAHLWFESIHPYPDATGLVGRAVALKAIGQSLPEPALIPLSPWYLSRRKDYHRALDEACRDGDATEWLALFAAAVIESCREYLARIEFVIAAEKLLRTLHDHISGRQETALRHLFRQGPEPSPGLDTMSYASIAGVPESVAEAEVAHLASLGALERIEHRHETRHRLNIPAPSVEKVRMEDLLR